MSPCIPVDRSIDAFVLKKKQNRPKFLAVLSSVELASFNLGQSARSVTSLMGMLTIRKPAVAPLKVLH